MRQRRHKQRYTRKISDHFSKKDFTCHCGECKESLKVSLGLVGGLELLRAKAKNRINIVKGFECLDSAEKSGKIKRNYHTKGIAADITIDNLSVKDVFLLAEKIPEFNGVGLSDDYVHVDTRKGDTQTRWIHQDDENIEINSENRSTYLG